MASKAATCKYRLGSYPQGPMARMAMVKMLMERRDHGTRDRGTMAMSAACSKRRSIRRRCSRKTPTVGNRTGWSRPRSRYLQTWRRASGPGKTIRPASTRQCSALQRHKTLRRKDIPFRTMGPTMGPTMGQRTARSSGCLVTGCLVITPRQTMAFALGHHRAAICRSGLTGRTR